MGKLRTLTACPVPTRSRWFDIAQDFMLLYLWILNSEQETQASLSRLPAAALSSALIGNYFSGLMPLFGLSPCGKEWRIMNLVGGSGARWDPGTCRTDHFCAGRDAGQLIFDPLGSSQARGVTAALSLAPHLNLNSILWCSYAPTWQASGVICSAQNAQPFFLCALTEIWVIKVKWNALGKKNLTCTGGCLASAKRE